jgi:hypothetical protein
MVNPYAKRKTNGKPGPTTDAMGKKDIKVGYNTKTAFDNPYINYKSKNKGVLINVEENTQHNYIHNPGSETTRFELKININPNNEDVGLLTLWQHIKELASELKAIDKSAVIIPWKKIDGDTPLNLESQPKSLEDIHKYIPRLRILKEGNTWGDLRLAHTTSWNDIQMLLYPWLQNKKHSIWPKDIQA